MNHSYAKENCFDSETITSDTEHYIAFDKHKFNIIFNRKTYYGGIHDSLQDFR